MRISGLLLACALTLSGIAAYYSIVGLAAIFASAFWPVVFMAGTLEISKLVLSSWLYQKWNVVPVLIKIYLTTAVIVLMIITSLGIFGFLSKAHVDQSLGTTDVTLKIEQIDTQITQIKDKITRYQATLQQLDRSINIQLDNQRVQQALVARRQQEKERDQIRIQLDVEQNTLQQLNLQKTQLRSQMSIIESKVGPIRYVAEFFSDGKNVDLDSAVRYMIVVLVLVFDPLAVLMLIAANMTYLKENQKDNVASHESLVTLHQSMPIYGQLIWDDVNKQTLRFDGNQFIPIKLIVDNQPVSQPNTDATTSYPIDINALQKVVKDSMTEWLTSASSEPQHNINNTHVDTNEPISNLSSLPATDEHEHNYSVNADQVITRINQHYRDVARADPSQLKPLWT